MNILCTHFLIIIGKDSWITTIAPPHKVKAARRSLLAVHFTGNFCGCFYGSAFFNCSYQAVVWSLSLLFMNTVYFFVLICMTSDCSSHTYIRHFPDSAPSNFPSNCFSSAEPLVLLKCSFGSPFFNNFTDFISSFSISVLV